MSSATRRAARLADHLSRETGVAVEVNWLCVRGEDWFVAAWRDGPDEASLRELAARHAGVAPTQVCSVRELTPIGSASALLLWLLEHPDHLDTVSVLTMAAAHSQVAYPERAPQAIVDLARAVLAVSARGRVDEETLTLLAPHARKGWAAFTGWLQSTSTSTSTTPSMAAHACDVVDLAAARRRRSKR